MSRAIQMTVTFTEADLNKMLKYSYMGDGNSPTVNELNDDQYNELKRMVIETGPNFVEEIVEGTELQYEWLADFMEQFEE